jgi:glutamate--cysteine ligase
LPPAEETFSHIERVVFKETLKWLQEDGNAELIRRGLRGVEKETLRIDCAGRLSHKPHPEGLGAALTHPFLTTDYSEALLEIVTPAYPANWEVLQFLCDIQAYVLRHLEEELLWCASMPCVMNPDQEIPIASYGPSNLGRMKTIYRRGLGYRYGRAMQAIAGVHFNFSLPAEFWEAYKEKVGGPRGLKDFKSKHYMAMVRNYRRCSWLVVYLFGASPAFCKSFRPQGHERLSELGPGTWYAPYATSLRMSDLGYSNKTQAGLSISANSLEEYLSGLRAAITTPDARYTAIGVRADGDYRQLSANILQIENEYYSSIRPKPRKPTVQPPAVALRDQGVEYVEVRTLDLNMCDPVGINQNELRFLEALLLHCLLVESPPISPREQQEIRARELLVAWEGRRPGLEVPRAGGIVPLARYGTELLDSVGEVAALLDVRDHSYARSVELQREALSAPEATPSARFLEDLSRSGDGFFRYALARSREHREYLLTLPVERSKEEFFRGLAAESLEDARAAAARPEPPFGEYLADYFRAIGR